MKSFPTLDPIATGRRIKELRRINNIKVDDIVNFMGFESQQAVYKWQRGDSLPSIDNLYALSRLFGTTVDDILVGCDEEEQSSSVHFKYFTFIVSSTVISFIGIQQKIRFEIRETLLHIRRLI